MVDNNDVFLILGIGLLIVRVLMSSQENQAAIIPQIAFLSHHNNYFYHLINIKIYHMFYF